MTTEPLSSATFLCRSCLAGQHACPDLFTVELSGIETLVACECECWED